ncbi:hypothetical protein ABPG74_012655 [Tetrahymena malaccensis]
MKSLLLIFLLTKLIQSQVVAYNQLDYLNPKNSFFKLSLFDINNKSIKFQNIGQIISCKVDGDNMRDLVFLYENKLYLSQDVVYHASLNYTSIISEGDFSLLQALGIDSYQNIFGFSQKDRKGYIFQNKFKNNLDQWQQQEVFSIQDIEQQLKVSVSNLIDVKIEQPVKGNAQYAILVYDQQAKLYYIIRNHFTLQHITYEIIYQGSKQAKILYFNFSLNQYFYSIKTILYDQDGNKYDLAHQIQQVFQYRDKNNSSFVVIIAENPYIIIITKNEDNKLYQIKNTTLEYANYYQNQDTSLRFCLEFQFFDFFGKEARNYLCQMKNAFRFIFEFPMQKNEESNHKLLYSAIDLDLFSNEKSFNHTILYENDLIKLDHGILEGQVFLINTPKGLFTMQNTQPNFDDLWSTNFWFELMTLTISLILLFGTIHFYRFGQRSYSGETKQIQLNKNYEADYEDDDDDDDDLNFDFPSRKNNRKTTI